MIYDFVLPDPCTVSAFVLLVPCALCFSLLTVCLLARPLCFPVCARARVGSVPPFVLRVRAFVLSHACARMVWFLARSCAHCLVPCALARALVGSLRARARARACVCWVARACSLSSRVVPARVWSIFRFICFK